jgi:hypothetical protein
MAVLSPTLDAIVFFVVIPSLAWIERGFNPRPISIQQLPTHRAGHSALQKKFYRSL